MHGSMNKKKDQDENERPINNRDSDPPLNLNRGVELLLRNKRRKPDAPKTFEIKFGRVIPFFKKEINLFLDFSLDVKTKESLKGED
jgi:hypothetical protein